MSRRAAKPKKQALGRGLGEIISAGSGLPRELKVDQLAPGTWQPRQRMDPAALGELAQTIAARGVLQPIIVRPAAEGFEIIAGERRWRAAQLAGLATVPAVVREFSDRDAMLAALVENTQREDLSPLDQAEAAQRIVDELRLPLAKLAPMLGMSRPALSNLLRLLKLPESVRRLLADERLSAGHARVIAGLPEERQAAVAKAVAERGLTVRQAEEIARTGASGRRGAAAKAAGAGMDPDTKRLCDELSAKLGMRIEIRGKGPKGRLVAHYRSLASLDGLLRKLRK